MIKTRFVCLLLALFGSFLAWAAAPAGPADAADAQPLGFVVVAPQAFHDVLAEFVAFKKAKMPTRLVALEEVLKSESGVDDPEKLKRFLYAGWKKKEISHVLLVGDADVLPVRYMCLDRVTPAAFDYAFYPSDLYYADVAKADGSFDDWNGAKEGFHAGYFGEVRGEKNKQDPINYDGISYVPELALGRWPVSTPAETALVAAKTLRHQRGLDEGNKPGAKRVGFFAVDGWVDSRGVLGAAADRLGKRLETSRYFYGQQPAPSEKELYAFLGDGAGLVVHAGHGHPHAWERCCSIQGLRKVKNADRLPVLLSCGCSTAYFAALPPYEAYTDVNGKEHAGSDKGEVFKEPPPPPSPYQKGPHNKTGMGEFVLKGGPDGAVAYIGCNTGSQPCGLSLAEGFCGHLADHPGAKLGDCWKAALAYYWKRERLADLKPNNDWYPPSIFFQGMKFMLFGDPTVTLP